MWEKSTVSDFLSEEQIDSALIPERDNAPIREMISLQETVSVTFYQMSVFRETFR